MAGTFARNLTEAQVRFLLDTAAAAPSVLNTQPWRFRVHGDTVDVLADPSRTLRALDPHGRSLTISCGAALFNIRLAIRHLGREPVVRLGPDAHDRALFASVRAGGPARPDTALDELFDAVHRRSTNREPFTDDGLAPALLRQLEHAARIEGGILRLLPHDEVERVSGLIHAADVAQDLDPRQRAEIAAWVAHEGDTEDGIPRESLGPRAHDPSALIRDFAPDRQVPGRRRADFESHPTIAVLSTARDDRIARLRAGQALQRVLLLATLHGVAASFLNQPLEREENLRRLVRDPSGDHSHPQMIMRLGYGSSVPSTPRRPVDELFATDE